MSIWSPQSWRERPAEQQPSYADPRALDPITRQIASLPPLIFSGEVEALKAELARAEEGRAFVLHGGDCAERFADCDRDTIVRKLKILLQMSLVLTHAGRQPVVRIGRIAGQYAKPRSSDTEVIDGVEIPAYRGDLINGLEATIAARTPDPARLLTAYFHAATTLNFIRALTDGGFADLHHAEHWRLDFMADAPRRAAFQAIADRIHDSIGFIESLGAVQRGILERMKLHTSHEGLLLPYEEAFTVRPPRRRDHYNLGAHFLWIGERTRQLGGAHVEYFRGLANPIGVKIGPSCAPDELVRLIEVLDPHDEPGRLTIITRYGANLIADHLPGHIRAVKAAGRRVLWSCDPMHGNGRRTDRDIKTRDFWQILIELEHAFTIHRAEGSRLGGVHFELTGDNVTECIGGSQALSEDDLPRAYTTGCDPRLNYAQSLEMAFRIAEMLRACAQPGRDGRS
jgi:3-deoxy-7-phosphoheptulonate synthase